MSLNIEKNKENFVRFVYNDSVKNETTSSENKGFEEEKTFPCFICGKSFLQKHSLSRHMKSHKANEGHECPKCSKRFVASRDLKKHVDIVHLNKADEYKKECPICHARVQQLKTHIRFIHRNEGKNTEYNGVCPHCDKTFSNDYKVKRHIETVHEGVKHWQCSICPKKFYEKKDLGRHIRGVHMGEKVDTWRNKKTCHLRKIPSQVVVTKNILSTVDIMSRDPQTTLPTNVLAEECEDKFDMCKESSCPESGPEEDIDNPASFSEYATASEYEEMEIDEVEVDENVEEDDLRFQVCDQRVDEEGNIVLEIIEKGQINDSVEVQNNLKNEEDLKMVTLRWGDTNDCNVDENSTVKNENDDRETSTKSLKQAAKVIDLNLRLEDIIHDSSEMSSEDFVLPEVVGDLPDWLLHGSHEIDILKMNNSGQNDNDLHTISKEGSESHLITPVKSEQDKQFDDLDEGTKTAFRCGACGKMFVTLEFLKNHIEKSHIQAKVCDDFDELDEVVTPNKTVFKFRNDKNGARLAIPVNHQEEVGDTVEKLAIKELGCKPDLKCKNSNEVLVCDIEGCDKTFSGKGKKLQYKRHVERIHLSIKNKQCPRCDLRFYEKRDLSRHIEAIHLRIRTICPIEGCARPVVRLDQHIKMVHTDKPGGKTDKSCKCPECGASFSRVYDMTRHRENVHRGYKNFSCDKCDRKFTDKRDLKRHHDAVHLNIKQTKLYACNYCDKTFKFKKHLDSHRVTDHDGQNFTESPDTQLFIQTFKDEPNHVKESDKLNGNRSHSTGSVVVTVNNINHEEAADINDKQENEVVSTKEVVATGEEFNTVEIDGQLFLVQQTASGLSLLPVVQTSDDTLALAVEQVQAFAVEN